MMKQFFNISTLGLLLVLPAPSGAQAQRSGLYLSGAPAIRLSARIGGIATSIARDSDDTTTLIWSGRKQSSKVTVSTFSPGQKFDLYVEATHSKNGKSVGRVKLVDGMMETNLIVSIKRKKMGSASLRYSVAASLEQGNTDTDLTDVHTVTYTITDQ